MPSRDEVIEGLKWRVGYRWYVAKHWVLERPEKLAWWLAWKLPRRIALFAFVRVYAVLGTCGDDYDQAYRRFEAGEGR